MAQKETDEAKKDFEKLLTEKPEKSGILSEKNLNRLNLLTKFEEQKEKINARIKAVENNPKLNTMQKENFIANTKRNMHNDLVDTALGYLTQYKGKKFTISERRVMSQINKTFGLPSVKLGVVGLGPDVCERSSSVFEYYQQSEPYKKWEKSVKDAIKENPELKESKDFKRLPKYLQKRLSSTKTSAATPEREVNIETSQTVQADNLSRFDGEIAIALNLNLNQKPLGIPLIVLDNSNGKGSKGREA